MLILDINFRMLKYCGVWRPSSMNNELGKFIYNVYTFVVVSTVTSITLQKFVLIPTTTKNLDDLVDHQFPFIEILCAITKGYNLLASRRKIESAIESMVGNPLYNRPINQSEADRRATTDRKCRFPSEIIFIHIIYWILGWLFEGCYY